MRVSCSDVSANAGLLTPTMVTGAAHRFSMRPKPAIIGIAIGGSRTQPSRTCGAQSRAQAGKALNAMASSAVAAKARSRNHGPMIPTARDPESAGVAVGVTVARRWSNPLHLTYRSTASRAYRWAKDMNP